MLNIKSLSFAFNRKPLFSNINISIKPGELVHLIGQNGSGKSTFMSVVAGFRSATAGSVSFQTSSDTVAPERSEHIEYLSAEANGFYTSMDATQNLKFWSSLRGYDYSDGHIESELSKWGLGHKLVRLGFPVAKFSTGMGRRLALARVSLSKCKCWLLDEPIYGLDAKGIELFRTMLVDHKESGGMTLIISHDTTPLHGIISRTEALDRKKQ